MKTLALILALLLSRSHGIATDWQFIGPDSATWRNAVQMDVSFQAGGTPRVGVATTQGICMMAGGSWNYVLKDYYGFPVPPEDVMYRSVYFSPWNDSVWFFGYNVHYSYEPGSLGARWGAGGSIGGGYVGFSPCLSFEFSPHHPGRVYSWIINLYKSTDEGNTWEMQENIQSYGALFLSFDHARDSVLYIGRKLVWESSFNVYRSTDDGESWTFVRPLSIAPPYGNQRSAELFANGDTLVLATNRFPLPADTTCGIFVSVDYGITWSAALSDVNAQKIIQDRSAPNTFYAAAQGGIYHSDNGGVAWHLFTDSLPSLNLIDIRKDPYSDTLYVATSDQGVYKVFDVALSAESGQQLPEVNLLLQNYPNPFNPSTTIQFQIAEHGFVSLKIFDVLGKEVATLVNDIMEPGRHEKRFDARLPGGRGSTLASGLYFCRLSFVPTSRQEKNEHFVQTTKLLLLR